MALLAVLLGLGCLVVGYIARGYVQELGAVLSAIPPDDYVMKLNSKSFEQKTKEKILDRFPGLQTLQERLPGAKTSIVINDRSLRYCLLSIQSVVNEGYEIRCAVAFGTSDYGDSFLYVTQPSCEIAKIKSLRKDEAAFGETRGVPLDRLLCILDQQSSHLSLRDRLKAFFSAKGTALKRPMEEIRQDAARLHRPNANVQPETTRSPREMTIESDEASDEDRHE